MSRVAWLLVLGACGSVEPKTDAAVVFDAPDDIDAADIDADIDAPDIDAPPPEPIAAGLIILFDGACPTGFTERTDLANLYLRGHDGDSTFGEIGGAATHTHQIAVHMHTMAMAGAAHSHALTFAVTNSTIGATPGGTLSGADPIHTHTATSSIAGGPHTHTSLNSTATATGAAATDPLFREVVLCEVTGTPTLLPTTAIVLETAACPSAWTGITNASGRLLRGHDLDGNLAEIGGTAMHVHSMAHTHGPFTGGGGDHAHTATAGAATMVFNDLTAGAFAFATGGHGHTVGLSGPHTHPFSDFIGDTGQAPVLPEYREIMECRPSIPAPLPADALALTTGPCPAGWIEVPEFRNRFLGGDDGDTTPSEVAGGAHTHDATHTHGTTGSIGHTHAVTSGTSTTTVTALNNGIRQAATASHTHTVNASLADVHSHAIDNASPALSSVEAIPPYVEVVVCKRE